MGPLETLGLGYVILSVMMFTAILFVLAYFGFKSLVGTITVKVTENERVHDTAQEDFDRENVSKKFQGYTISH